MTLEIKKHDIWGGLKIKKIGTKNRGYFWFGEGNKYLMSLTFEQAKKLSKFITKASK